MDVPNRQQARFMGKQARIKVVIEETGEVITARHHLSAPADAVAIWRDQRSVGTVAGLLYWWEDAPELNEAALRRKWQEWDDAGRPIEL